MTENQAVAAEEHVLGAMMLSRKAAETAFERLRQEHFYRRSHGLVFSAAFALHLLGQPVEPLLLAEQLRRAGELEEAGGEQRIRELAALVPATGNVAHYADLVADMWARRLLAKGLREAAQQTEDGLPAAEALEQAERKVLEVRERVGKGRRCVIPAGTAADWYAAKLANPTAESAGVKTPFRFIRPLQPSRLYVLGGYQGDGKSAVAVQFLVSAASAGARVGFVSVEMSWHDLTDRFVSCHGVPYAQAITGRVDPEHRPAADRAVEKLRGLPVEIIDDESVEPSALRRYQRVGRYNLLIIDHLHRFDWQERRELERHVRAITNLAREYEIPVLLLAQLHRRGDEFPPPTMSSIRESGMIEAEAAQVAFVWRKRDERRLPTREALYLVAKNRFGPTGAFELYFDAERVRFTEAETR